MENSLQTNKAVYDTLKRDYGYDHEEIMKAMETAQNMVTDRLCIYCCFFIIHIIVFAIHMNKTGY